MPSPAGRGIASLHHQRREGGHHLLIGSALEGNDQGEGLVETAPAPGVELDLAVGLKVDLGLVAGEAEGEPFLLLAREAARVLCAAVVGGEGVGDPFLGLRQQVDGDDAGLLGQFAAGGQFVVLAVIDAALGELPVVRTGRAGAAAVPDPAVGVEQDDADVGAVLAEGVGQG